MDDARPGQVPMEAEAALIAEAEQDLAEGRLIKGTEAERFLA